MFETTLFAPIALTRLALPLLGAASAPTVVTISSDAAVEAYPGRGGYDSGKAALDQFAAVLAIEQAYAAALARHYLRHEFGDSCLLLRR